MILEIALQSLCYRWSTSFPNIFEPRGPVRGPHPRLMLVMAPTWSTALFATRLRPGAAHQLFQFGTPPEISDAELARRIGGGDRWAEEAFYRRHVPAVLGLAQRLLANLADAEDVAQDTFVTAFQIWHQLRDYERARSWLLQITVRKVHRRFRRRRLLRLLGLDRPIEDAPLEALAREDTSAEIRSELAALSGALQAMPAKLKIVWVLRYIEGLPLEDVAAQCDCSQATVKRRIASAQRRVRRYVSVDGAAHE